MSLVESVSTSLDESLFSIAESFASERYSEDFDQEDGSASEYSQEFDEGGDQERDEEVYNESSFESEEDDEPTTVLAPDLVLLQETLRETKTRLENLKRIHLEKLMEKQERARQRRKNHAAELARAQKIAETARAEAQGIRERLAESRRKQILAENERSVFSTTNLRLQKEHDLLVERLQSVLDELALSKQENLALQQKHAEELRKANNENGISIEKLKAKLRAFEEEEEDRKKAFEEKSMVHVKEQEERLGRLESTLEKETVLLRNERHILLETQRQLEAKLDNRMKIEHNKLEEERRKMQLEFQKKRVDLESKHQDLEDRENRVLEQESLLIIQHSKLREKENETAVLRTCVETERDHLRSLKEEAALISKRVASKEVEAERRSQAALLQIEEAQQELIRAKEERGELSRRETEIQRMHQEIKAARRGNKKLEEELKSALGNQNAVSSVPLAENKKKTNTRDASLWESDLVKEMLHFQTPKFAWC